MTTNVMVRDLDLPVPDATDSRRLEVVVGGLPLFGGSQLAVDTTLVCALHGDGTPHAGAADTDGVVLSRARRRKERTYPELVGPGCRSRLVVLAVEGGRQVVTGDAHFRGPAGEVQSSTGTTPPAEESRASLEDAGGARSLHALRQRPSPHVCWTCGVLTGLMVMLLSHGRLRRITATRVWQGKRRCAVFER